MLISGCLDLSVLPFRKRCCHSSGKLVNSPVKGSRTTWVMCIRSHGALISGRSDFNIPLSCKEFFPFLGQTDKFAREAVETYMSEVGRVKGRTNLGSFDLGHTAIL